MKTTKLLLIGMMFAGALAHADVNCADHTDQSAMNNRSADVVKAADLTGTQKTQPKDAAPAGASSDDVG